MTVETGTLLTFLQLIVLSFTALIYIGQSTIRSNDSSGGMFSGVSTTDPARILAVGAICMALSGIAITIHLIIKLAAQYLIYLQLWINWVPLLSPWGTPPVFLAALTSLLSILLFRSDSDHRAWWILILVVVFAWMYAAVSTALIYQEWIPLFATGAFALGISLFFVALVRMSYLVLKEVEAS
ncbi:hypothetical protein [Halorubrum depositum]|uniref:hypothetical protein n=1 Tax=Halorubrum depositum TaxID=2583992 RepID=UPI0011A1081C|nr:hypothetical protein [Halorubrum depositum]